MALELLYGATTIGITYNTTTYESTTGVSISANTDLIFILKADPLATDVAADYTVTKGTDLTYGSSIITAKITDWSGLDVSKTYYVGVGFKLSGDTLYREIPLTEATRTINFLQDVIRA